MSKNKRKSLINILAIFICSFLVIFLLVRKDFKAVVTSLRNVQWVFLVIAILYQVLMPMMDGAILMILSRRYKKDYTFKEGYINNLVGLMFCFITPSATGGQFAQAKVFSTQGIHPSKSLSTLVVNFFTYEIASILFGLITIVFNFNYMSRHVTSFTIFGLEIDFLTLAILGFVVNLIAAFGILGLSYSRFINNLVHGIYKLLAKMRIIKDYNKASQNIDNRVAQFRSNIADLKNMKGKFVACLFLNMAKLTFQFMIPFWVAWAMGIHVDYRDIFVVISLSCYLMLITTFIPIPGSSGGAEFFFVVLFGPLLNTTPSTVTSIMLVWRFITFYIPLIYTAIITFVFNRQASTKRIDYVPTRHMWYFYKNFKEDNKYNEPTIDDSDEIYE